MDELLTEILRFLVDQWKYDIAVLSQPWMYYWLLIPAFGYLVFFFVKWAVLTAPFWLPLMMVFSSLRVHCRKGS